MFLLLPVILSAQNFETAYWLTDDSLSQAISLPPNTYPTGLVLLQSFADSLKFQISHDGTNYNYLHDSRMDSARVYVIEVDSSQTVMLPLDPDVFFNVRRFKILTDIDVSGNDTTCQVLYESKKWR